MMNVITAVHPLFDQPLVIEREAPFTRKSAHAHVMLWLMTNIIDVDWIAERNNLLIGINDEKMVPASTIR